MLTHHLVSLIRRELSESGESFRTLQKPGVLTVEHIKSNNIYFVVWNPFRGGTFQVLPCQNSELFDLISRRVHKAVQVYDRQKAAAERRKETVKQTV